MDDTIKEATDRLRNIAKGHKSKIKPDDNIELSFELFGDDGDSVRYEAEELPDLSVILKELNNPEELKLEVSKNGIVKQSLYLLKKPKPIPNQYQNQNGFPPPPQQSNFNFDIREFMGSMERIITGVTNQQKEMSNSQEKFIREVLTEIRDQSKDLLDKQKKETEKFYQDLLEDQRKFGKDTVEYERKINQERTNQEKSFWDRELERKENYYKELIELEKLKSNVTRDHSSSVVNSLKDYGTLAKDAIVGVLEVAEEHSDKIQTIAEIYQNSKNPIKDIPAV